MCCNPQIHDELKNIEVFICPFCDQQLIDIVEYNEMVEPCCSEQNIENTNGMNVCLNCGSVHGYDFVNAYIDFHDNIHRIYKKSVYHRKYHIENVLNDICIGNRVELTRHQRDRIHKAFVEIGTILNQVNRTRKRMISS